MQIRIDWAEPIIPKRDVLQIQPFDLDGFYVAASDFDKNNIFFMLLTSYHHYEAQGERCVAAHLCFLIAYYLFIALTPPGSCELAMHYINQAIALEPLPVYQEWRVLIEKEN